MIGGRGEAMNKSYHSPSNMKTPSPVRNSSEIGNRQLTSARSQNKGGLNSSFMVPPTSSGLEAPHHRRTITQ